MQKLLGFFILLSILTLHGEGFIKTAQAQEPIKYYFDDGISPEHQNPESRQKVDGSPEFFNSTWPQENFYPHYFGLYDYKPDNLFLIEGDNSLLSEIKNNPYWKNVSFLNPNFTANWDTGWNNGNEHSWFVFRVLTSHSGQVNMFYGYNADEVSRQNLYNLAKANPKNIYIFSGSFAPDNCTESWKVTTTNNAMYDLSVLPNVRLNFGAANKGCQLNAGNSYSFYPNVVSVSSLNSSQTAIASWSNVILWHSVENRRVQTIFSPGQSLPSLDSKYQVTHINGTSFSTPQKSALDSLLEKLRLSLGIAEITPQNQFFDLQIASADQITDTTRFTGTTVVANVLNGVDSLLSYEAFLTQKPACHPKYSTIVQNSPFELGCGFNSGISKPVIADCNVAELSTKNGVIGKYSVTCANVGTQTVIANGVSAGSLEIISAEIARSQMVETSQMVSVDGKNFAYNLTASNPISLYVKLTITNATNITQEVSYNLDKNFWGNCTGKDGKFDILGTPTNPVYCQETALTKMSDQLIIQSGNPQFFSRDYSPDKPIQLAAGTVKVLVFQLEKFDVSKGLQIPCFTFEGAFSSFCTPSITFGTPPTPTPTASKYLYLPVVVRRK